MRKACEIYVVQYEALARDMLTQEVPDFQMFPGKKGSVLLAGAFPYKFYGLLIFWVCLDIKGHPKLQSE